MVSCLQLFPYEPLLLRLAQPAFAQSPSRRTYGRMYSSVLSRREAAVRSIEIRQDICLAIRRAYHTSTTPVRVSEDDLFSYKGQRWLWNEPKQLQRRYCKFNLEALVRAAEDAVGSGARCAEVTKLPEGNFNKTFVVEMQDRQQVIARLPNPNAGQSHFTTASEVATMDYVQTRLQIPVLKVLAYSTQANMNTVGAEYMIMEKCRGIELGRLWDDLFGMQKVDIVRQLATFSAQLAKSRFSHYGSLYYSRDIPEFRGTEVDDTFSVGPTTSRTWFDDKRGEIDIHRGPWTSANDVLTAIVERETLCLNTFSDFPPDRQQGFFNGPGGYHPSKSAKRAVIQDYNRVLPYLIPKDDSHIASMLWHNDLHSDNIFVDKEHPTQITGIIDWQGVHLSPAFLHVHYPSLIEYDGLILEGLKLPQLPSNFAELDPTAKEKAQSLHTSQSIWGLYQIFLQKQAPDLLRVLRYRETLPCQIMTLMGSIFDDGEPYVQSLLAQVAESETWSKVIKNNLPNNAGVSCPLKYTDMELETQQKELGKWQRDIERRARVIQGIGAYTGWDGAVPPEEYNVMSERLETARLAFLEAESRTSQEREHWACVWPFKDHLKSSYSKAG